MNNSILIINSNETEAEEIRKRLSSADTDAYCAASIQTALMLFVKHDFCLVILDACMLDDDHNLLKAMRNARSTPILVLSSKAVHEHRIHALQAGAHAYTGQQYTYEECMAQAHSLMKMYTENNSSGDLCYTLAFGNDLLIDPSTRQVFVKGKELKLTRKELDLLFCLASSPGRVFTLNQLYNNVWTEQAAYNVESVIRTHISSLKQKLSESNQKYIKNVWGVGYRFNKAEGDKW